MPTHARPHLHQPKQAKPYADSPMPKGFFRCLRGRTAGHPELRLAAAVLEDAAQSFKRTHGAGDFHRRVIYWEVERWFTSRSFEPVFSFERICSMLDLDANAIRRLLQRWAESRHGGPVPTFLDWAQPRLKRRPLKLVTGARVPESREARVIPEATAPQSNAVDPDARTLFTAPGSRSA
jgi:hypothetical protein